MMNKEISFKFMTSLNDIVSRHILIAATRGSDFFLNTVPVRLKWDQY